MDLWTWFANLVVNELKALFERLRSQRDEYHQMAKDAHADAGCNGPGKCKFCDKLAEVKKD